MSPICPITVLPASREDLQVLPGWFPTEAELIQWGGPRLQFPLDEPQLSEMWAETCRTPAGRLIWSGWQEGNRMAAHAQAVMDWAQGRARLSRIGLHPSLRGQGLAQDFLAKILGLLGQVEGISLLELNVYSFNQPAIRLYQRLGFQAKEATASTTTIAGASWDVIRMARELP